MKNNLWILVVLILAALFVMEFRYTLVINSPIVAKIDRITGDVWIANSGMWIKVKHPAINSVAKQAVSAAPKAAEASAAQPKGK